MNRSLRLLVVVTALLAGLVVVAAPTGASTPPAVAGWNLPTGLYSIRPWQGAMWLVRTDDFHSAVVDRVDPTTDTLTTVTELRFTSGGFAVGYGSLWITDWFGNAVWRLAPDGTVQARIPTGLQPGDVQIAFGSVWTANHHGASVTRIDPVTDGVIATVTAGDPHSFRDGPGTMVSDGRRLWVTNGDLDHAQAVDPVTDRVSALDLGADQACGGIPIAAAGRVWLPDVCSGALYGHRPDGTIAVEVDYPVPAAPMSFAAVGGSAWVGVDRQFDPNSSTGSHGVLEQRDLTTGALRRTIPLGGDVGGLAAAFGSLWVVDQVRGSLRRVDPGTGVAIGVPAT